MKGFPQLGNTRIVISYEAQVSDCQCFLIEKPRGISVTERSVCNNECRRRVCLLECILPSSILKWAENKNPLKPRPPFSAHFRLRQSAQVQDVKSLSRPQTRMPPAPHSTQCSVQSPEKKRRLSRPGWANNDPGARSAKHFFNLFLNIRRIEASQWGSVRLPRVLRAVSRHNSLYT